MTMTQALPHALTIQSGDIVSFRFPSTEGDVHEKARPCLVLAISGDQATVVYGTSSAHRANRGLELRVTRQDDLDALHLRHPTRFVGARRVTVGLDSPRFRPRRETGSCVIGSLPPSLQSRLAHLQSLIGADDAARTSSARAV